jgi:hypothetical protein
VNPVSTPKSLQVLLPLEPLIFFVVRSRKLIGQSLAVTAAPPRAARSLCSLSAAQRQPQRPFRRAPLPSAMADASLMMRRRPVPEAEKMTRAASILADSGRLIWLGEQAAAGCCCTGRWFGVARRRHHRRAPRSARLGSALRLTSQDFFHGSNHDFIIPRGMGGFDGVWARDLARPGVTERENLVGLRFYPRGVGLPETRPIHSGMGITEQCLKGLQSTYAGGKWVERLVCVFVMGQRWVALRWDALVVGSLGC